MRKSLPLFIVGLLITLTTMAQERMITGKVNASDGSALPGVNVVLKGTSIGSVTDSDGNYSVSVPNNSAVLTFSFIGFVTQEKVVGSSSIIDILLEQDVQQLAEVVVTAVGIERDKRSLGYSVQEIKSDALTQRSSVDVLTSLQGKVAGVNIVGGSGAAGASVNINIRGTTSFAGSNQPLFIVDGIPISNVNQEDRVRSANLLATTTLFDSQPANRALDISPDNIETINILKGPAAAALYGSRASAGAVIITTKSGRNSQGKMSVTLNSSVNFQDAFGLPKLQNQYGQGNLGVFNNLSGSSWGPPFEVLNEVETAQGETVPYQAYPDNIKDFFRRGKIVSNTLTLVQGKENWNYLLSIGNAVQDGIVKNSEFDRTNIQLKANAELGNGLKAGGSFSFINTKQLGATQGNGGSAFGQLTRIPRSYDLIGRPYKDEFNNSIYFSPSQNHPLWSLENELSSSNTDRLIGSFDLSYDATKWLSFTYRAGGDIFTTLTKGTYALGSARFPNGRIIEDSYTSRELNSDLIATAKGTNLFLDGLDVSILIGKNLNQRQEINPVIIADQLGSNFFNINNASVFTSSFEGSSKRRLVGVYSQLSLSYKNYLFLEGTARVDKSSTLPKNNNTYLYPSASISAVITDILKLDSRTLSYAKVRYAIAKVGRDAPPYSLITYYTKPIYGNNVASVQFPFGGLPGFGPASNIGSGEGLTPEFTNSYEAGINLGLFQNKINVDFTYFYSLSENQIFNVGVPSSTGFNTRTSNVGALRNEGIEVMLSATPIKVKDFRWDVSLNYTRIRNKVLEIAPGVTQFAILSGQSFGGIVPSIFRGQPYGVISGNRLQRSPSGEYLINPLTGQFSPPQASQPISDPNPDWLAAIANNFSYKGFILSCLIDTRQGGQIYSFNAQDLKALGSFDFTGENRDLPRILPGVIQNEDGSFRPNNIQISAEAYWAALGGLASESAVFDATVYRLRELSLGYSLPASLLSRTPFGEVTVSISGRNLAFFAPGYPLDPEVNKQGAGNLQGLDLNGPPSSRNYGFNLKLSF